MDSVAASTSQQVSRIGSSSSGIVFSRRTASGIL